MRKVRNLLFSVVAVLVVGFTSVRAQEQTIVDLAAGNPDFSTLVSLITDAGLVDTLAGVGPFTVFAPTNDAFAALPAEVITYLSNHPDTLSRVLTYHVVDGAVMSSDLNDGMVVASAEGGDLNIGVSDAGVTVDGVHVVTADIAASNGVIHAVDGVLLPTIELPEVDALNINGDILVAGSSTVLPVSERIASLFTDAGFTGALSVEGGGSGAGFEKFCTNLETDIADASRAIKSAETEACAAGGRPAVAFQIGVDALTVVVSRENDFVDTLSLETLGASFSGTYTRWNQVNPAWPDQSIVLFSPGTDSGTFSFFVETVLENDQERLLNAAGLNLSEDDNTLVAGVESGPYAIGYFGGAYYFQNQDRLRAISIEDVAPTGETAESGAYPLSRPLYIYTSAAVIADKPQVGAFINFYLTSVDDQLGIGEGEIGYFPASKRLERLNRLLLLAISPLDR